MAAGRLACSTCYSALACGDAPAACLTPHARAAPAARAQAPRTPWSCAPRGCEQRLARRGGVVARSSSEPEASFPASMSLEDAYKLLDVSESAGFEDILAAKRKLAKQYAGDGDRIVQARAHYGSLLRMRWPTPLGSARRTRPCTAAHASVLPCGYQSGWRRPCEQRKACSPGPAPAPLQR
jgi:hypothetical protein